jgi:SPP1 family predicted phage head-tail adaptor
MRKLQAGDFDRLGLFKKPVESRDSFGQDVTTYTTVLKWFVGVYRQKGKEEVEAAQIQAVNITQFVTRYNKSITEDLLLVVENKTYNIRSIEEIEGRRKFYKIVAERRDNE